jgi:uncharacterized membrane protein
MLSAFTDRSGPDHAIDSKADRVISLNALALTKIICLAITLAGTLNTLSIVIDLSQTLGDVFYTTMKMRLFPVETALLSRNEGKRMKKGEDSYYLHQVVFQMFRPDLCLVSAKRTAVRKTTNLPVLPNSRKTRR